MMDVDSLSSLFVVIIDGSVHLPNQMGDLNGPRAQGPGKALGSERAQGPGVRGHARRTPNPKFEYKNLPWACP